MLVQGYRQEYDSCASNNPYRTNRPGNRRVRKITPELSWFTVFTSYYRLRDSIKDDKSKRDMQHARGRWDSYKILFENFDYDSRLFWNFKNWTKWKYFLSSSFRFMKENSFLNYSRLCSIVLFRVLCRWRNSMEPWCKDINRGGIAKFSAINLTLIDPGSNTDLFSF